ncbi:MAG: hypothetical protein F6K17_34755 [Okeania sp. SIO3C4]|nr:hypothetical protein [Okeania sp. SIO3B3]NER07362.1 hypothetical protein [Okeania sp. SIO3C4]
MTSDRGHFSYQLSVISCSVEYLRFGGRKALMLFAQHSAGKAAMLKGRKGSKG